MSNYTATIRWSRTGDGDFAKGQYSRAHAFVMPDLIRHPPSFLTQQRKGGFPLSRE